MHNLHESIVVAVIYLNTYNYSALHFKSILNCEKESDWATPIITGLCISRAFLIVKEI